MTQVEYLKIDRFLHHMRDMETALMQVFGGVPVRDIVLREDVYNVVMRRIRDINPYLDEHTDLDRKWTQYGSLRLSTRLKADKK